MPNHVSNHLKFQETDDNYKAVEAAWNEMTALMKTDDSPFDFNVLIPYPEKWAVLDKARSAAEKAAMESETYAATWSSLPADGYNQGGYQWCIQNWGTKWNAYDITVNDYYEGVRFQTAWSTPLPIFIALSKRFPEMTLEVEYADEDTGRNCGILTIIDGTVIHDATDKDGVHPFDEREATFFARAINAEQSSAEHWQELNKAQDIIAGLRKEIEKLSEPKPEAQE